LLSETSIFWKTLPPTATIIERGFASADQRRRDDSRARYRRGKRVGAARSGCSAIDVGLFH